MRIARGGLGLAGTVSWLTLACAEAVAIELPLASHSLSQGAAGVSLLIGMAVFATTTALLHLTGRRRWQQREVELTTRLNAADARAERIDAMLSGERQVVISWGARGEAPMIEGDLDCLDPGASLLAFGTWVAPESAQNLETAIDNLKGSGEAFSQTIHTKKGVLIEVAGRPVGGRAVLRMREVSGIAAELNQIQQRHLEADSELEALRALVDSLPYPVWSRDATGHVAWANQAYLAAVEAADLATLKLRGLELLDQSERERAALQRQSGQAAIFRAPAVVAGQRRILDVFEQPLGSGSVGIAIDVTQIDEARAHLQRQMDAHAATLDRLATAVAIFDSRRSLVFRNPAFDKLWGFEPGFLESQPSHSDVLDRQRALRRAPELGEFKVWKAGVLAAYAASEPSEEWWYLPDGRVVHAVSTPNPQGGITMLFDDATEQRSLESKVNTLGRVQTQTLEALREGVAVFGSDGRLRLGNPAFAEVWQLDPDILTQAPHIEELATRGAPMVPQGEGWANLVGLIAGVRDARHDHAERFELTDGKILDATLSALPDGGTLLTFVDVTDSVNLERSLTDSAAEMAKLARLREDFVHRVSYELRAPLTNIIGFAQLIGEGAAGPLSDRQREYTDHILRSSGTLLEHVNDILDLAAMDNGDFALNRTEVDLAAVIRSAGDSLADRMNEKKISFIASVEPAADALVADEPRLRQILRNLLSNAVSFSEVGSEVAVEARRDGTNIAISVVDHGCGIPASVQQRVFGRFESDSLGSSHRGVGLGLAIAKSLVEQHGGVIALTSSPGQGTTVTCTLPRHGARIADAAE